MKCAVFGCRNTNDHGKRKENMSFFKFPRDEKRQKMFVHFCRRRTGEIKVKTARICSDHFLAEDIIKENVFFASYGLSPGRARLKPTAVPTLPESLRDIRTRKRNAKQLSNKPIVTIPNSKIRYGI